MKKLKRTVDITVKKIPNSTNNLLSEKAFKAGLSKNEYIINLLNTHVVSAEVEGIKRQYEDVIQLLKIVIEDNTRAMNEFIRINEED